MSIGASMQTYRNVASFSARARLIAFAMTAALLLMAASFAARADEDLPGRVGRIAEFAGQLYLSPEDRATEWQPIGLNYPVASGDNLWVGGDGRAEVDYGGGQFRLAGDTSVHVSRLDENRVALFIAQGRVIIRVRVLDAGDSARIDAPNSQIQLTRPGLYRIDVAPDRQSTYVSVREGEVVVMLANGAQQALPGQTAIVAGPDPQYAEVRNVINQDDFDTWSANRDRRYDAPRATAYVSPQMIGYADLDQYGTWQSTPEYGPVWYPTAVAADWAPYRDGYWTNVGGWGSTWVDAAPWGYAPFHYGRWAWVRGRWGWCPGAFVARPRWAPALVGWVGGPGWGVSASFGSPVYGWVPLGWGEPLHPWWNRCSYNCWANYNRPYAVDVAVRPSNPPSHFRNADYPGALTAASGATIAARRPVASNRVTVPTHLTASAPVLASAPAVPSGPLRIPGARTTGAGTPPPASTFYPVSRGGRLTAEPMTRPAAASPTAPGGQSVNRPYAGAPAPANARGYAGPAPVVVTPATAAPGAPARVESVSRPRPQSPPLAASANQIVPTPGAPPQPAATYAAPNARPAPARAPSSERIGAMPPTPHAGPPPAVGIAVPAGTPSAHTPQALQPAPQAAQAQGLVRPEGGRAEHPSERKPPPKVEPGQPLPARQ